MNIVLKQISNQEFDYRQISINKKLNKKYTQVRSTITQLNNYFGYPHNRSSTY